MVEQHKPHKTTIMVNGQPKEWDEKEITYKQVVELAFPGSSQDYTVTYTHGHKEIQLVAASDPVKVHEGMEFDVDGTNNA